MRRRNAEVRREHRHSDVELERKINETRVRETETHRDEAASEIKIVRWSFPD